MDEEAFEAVFRTYYASVRNFVYFKTGDMEAAEDLTQDAFYRLWEMRGNVRLESVKSFLYTIAGNMAINMLKRDQLRFKFVDRQDKFQADTHSPEFKIQEEEYKAFVEDVLAKMPEKSRIVFLMNRIDDLKYREIAERLEISIKAVEKRMAVAMEFIRENLGRNL